MKRFRQALADHGWELFAEDAFGPYWQKDIGTSSAYLQTLRWRFLPDGPVLFTDPHAAPLRVWSYSRQRVQSYDGAELVAEQDFESDDALLADALDCLNRL